MVEFMVSILVADIAEGKRWAGNSLYSREYEIVFIFKKRRMFSSERKISIHPLHIAPTPPPSPQAKPSSATKENSKVYELAEIYPCFGRTSSAHSGYPP